MMFLKLVKIQVDSTVRGFVLARRLGLLVLLLQSVLVDVAIQFTVEACNHLIGFGFTEKFTVCPFPAAY